MAGCGPTRGRPPSSVRVATAVQGECTVTGVALAAAEVNPRQAQVITRVMSDLPPVDPDGRVAGEAFLIGQAAVLDPVQLGRAGRALAETLTTWADPDISGGGRTSLSLPDPRRRRDEHAPGAALRGIGSRADRGAGPAGRTPTRRRRDPDPRSVWQRRADALTDLARLALAGGALPESGGVKPSLVVTISVDVLRGEVAGAGLVPDG
ncbi:MAG: DUF222 domain-containing protein [Pseudonocardiales bacterium]